MRFLIDADLPRSTRLVVENAGHEALDVRDVGLGDVGLGDAEDPAIAARAKADQLCLLTGDFGFADVRNYPPDQYAGLVVRELPKDATAEVILDLVQRLLDQVDVVSKLPARLVIVSFGRVRLRPKG